MRVGCWRLSARIRNLLESHSVHRAVAPAGCRPELSGLRRLSVADRRAIGAASRQQQNCQQLRLCLKGCHRKVTGSVQFGFIRLTRLLLASALTLLWPDGAVALDRKLEHPLAQERSYGLITKFDVALAKRFRGIIRRLQKVNSASRKRSTRAASTTWRWCTMIKAATPRPSRSISAA